MGAFDAQGPRYSKTWEMAGNGDSIANPNLVVLNRTPEWKPLDYVSYLWLLMDGSELRVGIETQAAGRDTQGKAYGHPTLAQGTAGLKALYGGELLYKPSKGGWIINEASGRYGLNRRNPSDNRPAFARSALLEQVRGLFRSLVSLDVTISDYTVASGG